MEFHKCDRCKCIIKESEPIIVHIMNQNEIKGEHLHISGAIIKEFQNVTWELCIDCAQEVIHWLAHQENELKNGQKT